MAYQDWNPLLGSKPVGAAAASGLRRLYRADNNVLHTPKSCLNIINSVFYKRLNRRFWNYGPLTTCGPRDLPLWSFKKYRRKLKLKWISYNTIAENLIAWKWHMAIAFLFSPNTDILWNVLHYPSVGDEGWLGFPDPWSGQNDWYLTPVVNFGEV